MNGARGHHGGVARMQINRLTATAIEAHDSTQAYFQGGYRVQPMTLRISAGGRDQV